MEPDVASICRLCSMEVHLIRSIPPKGRTRFSVGATTPLPLLLFPLRFSSQNTLQWLVLLPTLGATTIKNSLGSFALADPGGFTMGDTSVRRPVASHFEKGVDFRLIIHKSPFMADQKDSLVLSNYVFKLLVANHGVAGFLIRLHWEDVDAVVESVTPPCQGGCGDEDDPLRGSIARGGCGGSGGGGRSGRWEGEGQAPPPPHD